MILSLSSYVKDSGDVLGIKNAFTCFVFSVRLLAAYLLLSYNLYSQKFIRENTILTILVQLNSYFLPNGRLSCGIFVVRMSQVVEENVLLDTLDQAFYVHSHCAVQFVYCVFGMDLFVVVPSRQERRVPGGLNRLLPYRSKPASRPAKPRRRVASSPPVERASRVKLRSGEADIQGAVYCRLRALFHTFYKIGHVQVMFWCDIVLLMHTEPKIIEQLNN